MPQVMQKVIDKKALWSEALEAYEEFKGAGMLYWILRNECFIDRVEAEHVYIAVPHDVAAKKIKQDAYFTLSKSLAEALGRPVSIRTVLGHPRLFVQPEDSPQVPADIPPAESEKHELAILHQTYGDIMGIVDRHPLFKKATLARERGGWGIYPQLLTNKCKDYGVMAILTALRFISSRPSIRNPRGFFLDTLDKGQWGHKLVVTPSLTGPTA